MNKIEEGLGDILGGFEFNGKAEYNGKEIYIPKIAVYEWAIKIECFVYLDYDKAAEAYKNNESLDDLFDFCADEIVVNDTIKSVSVEKISGVYIGGVYENEEIKKLVEKYDNSCENKAVKYFCFYSMCAPVYEEGTENIKSVEFKALCDEKAGAEEKVRLSEFKYGQWITVKSAEGEEFKVSYISSQNTVGDGAFYELMEYLTIPELDENEKIAFTQDMTDFGEMINLGEITPDNRNYGVIVRKDTDTDVDFAMSHVKKVYEAVRFLKG